MYCCNAALEGTYLLKKICVVGLGYIGLPTATILAAGGAEVVGVDVRPEVVEAINRAEITIEEPGLAALLKTAVLSGNLRAVLSPEPADVYIVAVPTPINADHRADMSCVVQAAESIVPCLKKDNLVILESTSPPGTCRDLLAPILERSGLSVGADLHLAYCPERVLPGQILEELVHNDRVVGGITPESANRARVLYERFVQGDIVLTDATTAEMVKLLENTYRDVNIALANEAALLCERLGINFGEVVRHANRHPRVHVHQAGPGVGGHCIAVDPWFLVEIAPEDAGIIQHARYRNDAMPGHVAETARGLLKDVASPKVAVLGLAYKADVDDVRESPALKAAALLLEQGLTVQCYDPHVPHAPVPQGLLHECLEGADLVMLLTDHAEFKQLNPEKVGVCMRGRRLYDTRNVLDHAAWRAAGFEVTVLGVGSAGAGVQL